ncbi:MAG: BatD family protein [Gammaproteobacteria bacterium]
MVARIAFILLTLWASNTLAATLTASVDRKELAVNEHIVFTLSLINSDTRLRAEGISPNVDLSVLTKNFDLGTPRADNRFILTREGGRSTSSITVELFPKRPGAVTIPAFSVDGLRSQPVTIKASPTASNTNPEVFIRSGVNKTTVWAREQTIAHIDLYHRINLTTASLGGDIEASPMRIDLMEYRKLPQAERKEEVAGISYNVQRIAWAIFPAQSGELTVRLPDVWAITANGRRLRLPGGQHRLQVKALPAGIPADILVGKPEISQAPLTALPDANSLTSLSITLRAPVGANALPGTLPGLAAPAQVKLYQDNAQRRTDETADGLTNVATYILSVTPLAAGNFRLPPIRLRYFDPQRGVMDTVESPGQTLLVNAGPKPVTPAVAAPASRSTAKIHDTSSLAWQITALTFAVLWLATLGLWLRARRTPPLKKSLVKEMPGETKTFRTAHPLQAILLDAFGAPSLEQGLGEWEARFGVDQELRETVRTVQRLYYGKQKVDEEKLRPTVQAAVARIHAGAPIKQAIADRWSPQAFTSRV